MSRAKSGRFSGRSRAPCRNDPKSRPPALGDSALRPGHACRGGDSGRRREPRRAPLHRSHRDRHSARHRHSHGLGAGSSMARGDRLQRQAIAGDCRSTARSVPDLCRDRRLRLCPGGFGRSAGGSFAGGHLRHQPIARSAGSPFDPGRLRQLDLRQFGDCRGSPRDRRQQGRCRLVDFVHRGAGRPRGAGSAAADPAPAVDGNAVRHSGGNDGLCRSAGACRDGAGRRREHANRHAGQIDQGDDARPGGRMHCGVWTKPPGRSNAWRFVADQILSDGAVVHCGVLRAGDAPLAVAVAGRGHLPDPEDGQRSDHHVDGRTWPWRRPARHRPGRRQGHRGGDAVVVVPDCREPRSRSLHCPEPRPSVARSDQTSTGLRTRPALPKTRR